MASSASPFGALERALAWRYVRARREHGGLSITAILSFAGIALAVWALIVIMSIMAGFRATLLDALLGGPAACHRVGPGSCPAEEVDTAGHPDRARGGRRGRLSLYPGTGACHQFRASPRVAHW